MPFQRWRVAASMGPRLKDVEDTIRDGLLGIVGGASMGPRLKDVEDRTDASHAAR